MQDNYILSLRERLESLPTAELDEMMQLELKKDTPDSHAVLLILDILEQREKAEAHPVSPQERQSRETYRKRMAEGQLRPKQAKVLRRNWWLTGAAVLVLLLTVVIPQRAGAESIWDTIAWWKSSILEFFSPGKTTNPVEFVFKTDNPGLQQVYDEVQALGVDKPLIPTWFLDGAELKSCEYTQTSATDRVTAYFSHENNVAVITADVYKQSELRGFYRDDTHAEIIELEGIEFYITQNKTKWVAVWSKENTEYFLTVDCQEDALQRILKSIFVLEE